MRIAIACDHAGYELKLSIMKFLKENNISFIDFGCSSIESVDYPDYAHKLACSVVLTECKLGIIICGSGNGVNMTVNKYDEIRSALCWNKEIAVMARLHNDANVLALPARYITKKIALEIVDTFIKTGFEGGRHLKRVNKISKKSC